MAGADLDRAQGLIDDDRHAAGRDVAGRVGNGHLESVRAGFRERRGGVLGGIAAVGTEGDGRGWRAGGHPGVRQARSSLTGQSR